MIEQLSSLKWWFEVAFVVAIAWNVGNFVCNVVYSFFAGVAQGYADHQNSKRENSWTKS